MYTVERKHDGFHVRSSGMIKRVYRSESDAKQWVHQMEHWLESSEKIRRTKGICLEKRTS